MASKYRLNRYNWFGHKLLTQHRYNELILLRNDLTTEITNNSAESHRTRESTEYLTYLQGLTLLKSSVRINEVIFSLQQLNLDQCSEYFILLCRALLYLGHYDSVVAICRQLINKEIDAIPSVDLQDQKANITKDDLLIFDSILDKQTEDNSEEIHDHQIATTEDNKRSTESNSAANRRRLFFARESIEFRKVIANISRNKSINDPNLWLIFATCLEYQRQFRDSWFAYQVATKLVISEDFERQQQNMLMMTSDNVASNRAIGTSDYMPCYELARFCFRHGQDIKTAQRVLSQASSLLPTTCAIDTLWALTVCGHSTCGPNNVDKAMAIITSLETQTKSLRNPSSIYNKLVRKCRTRAAKENGSISDVELELTSDESKDSSYTTSLNFVIAKIYIALNQLVHDNAKTAKPTGSIGGARNSELTAQDDRLNILIDTMLDADSSCWRSSSYWNNLGLLFMAKRKFVASLSCLTKANQMAPCDWRINFNLGLVCHRVGLISRALNCLIVAKSSRSLWASTNLQRIYSASTYRRSQTLIANLSSSSTDLLHIQSEPQITTLLAASYQKLSDFDAARRVYLETINLPTGSSNNNTTNHASSLPVLALLNYIIFLDGYGNSLLIDAPNQTKMTTNSEDQKQIVKLKLQLLDQFEQAWLQRNQSDCQFNSQLLEVATRLSDHINNNSKHVGLSNRKLYAWMKGQQ